MSPIEIQNSVLLITGANREKGIGKALVIEAIRRGAQKVYATSRNISELKNLSSQYPKIVIPLCLDVTNQDEINKVAEIATDTQILINNSGFSGHTGVCFNYDEVATRQEIEVNYFGPLNLIRAFLKTLIKNKNAAIVNVISIAGLSTYPLAATYSASKAAAHSLTQSVRAELMSHGVPVFGVYPGPIDTDMTVHVKFQKDSSENAARRIFDGIEQGLEDITTDGFSDDFVERLKVNAKAVEQENVDRVYQMPEYYFEVV